MRAILAALATKNPDIWDEYVAVAAFAYNTSLHRSINNTPFFLMYGRDPNLTLQEGVVNLNRDEPGGQWYTGLMDAREAVMDYMKKAALSNKEAYDRKVRPQEFRPGDAVLVRRNPPANMKGPRKLLPRYVGPYRIERIMGTTATVRPIRAPDTPLAKCTTVIFDQLRHCEADQVMLFPPERRTDPAEIDEHLETETE